MIILLRSTDGDPDSRFQKYVTFLEQKSITYYTLCWDRFRIKQETKKHLYYQQRAEYGKRTGNIFNLIRFNVYLLKWLIRKRKQYKIIHACDFDTILPAICMKFFFRKKVIYDIFDWYIDSRNVTNPLLKKLLTILEYVNIKSSDAVIICEEERAKQIRFTPKRLWVLPNIPYFSENVIETKRNANKQSCTLNLSYVGVLGECRGLDKIVRYVKEHSNVYLNIAGFGVLETLLKDWEHYPNIKFYGTVKYEEGLNIMADSDVICALYEKSNPNHLYAAPNKYYESLFLGKPLITTEGTLVGNKTQKGQTGYVIGETYKDLCEVLDNITEVDLQNYSRQAKILWNTKYENYVSDFMNETYWAYIKAFR